ncbi:hypothetical protein P691DRAFT_409807 [Macrolepiota fuliginosa MF-IS2]|uniref:Uncharacterized protein n=1 Tax=Macrolepiota fuliginosa MF-IS2 TaxID=1400762 RepID=A0A9P5XJT4_9AGAR|nr:hypothetical protein P691DRAFT_409807 [Macrolepiota fuliginosa MF-IS2]
MTMRAVGLPKSADASVSRKPSPAPRIAPSTRNEGEKRVIRAVDLSKTTTITRAPSSSSSDPKHLSTNSLPDTNTGNLKRKRLNSKTPPASDSRSAVSHQVTTTAPSPATTNSARPTALSSLRASKPMPSARATGQATQKPTVGKFRRVMPPEPLAPPPPVVPKEAPHPTVPIQQPALTTDGQRPNGELELHLSPRDDMILSSPTSEAETRASPLSSPAAITLSASPPPPLPSAHPPLVFVIDPLSPAFESTPLPESTSDESGSKTHMRRTTRLRKAAQPRPGQDVFDSDPAAPYNTTRPLQRRRMNGSQNSRSNADDVFSGMSMTALKALTVNNTMQNQYYAVAKLETEIVRKDGARPESPAVKIKTIVQRQQEEKAKQREERAARRARRHGTADSTDGDDGANGDEGGYESSGSANGVLATRMETLLKHRRGAGDEEDYETPLKTTGGENEKRRVKWDKGLFTEVFLDEVVLGSKAPPKENLATKGCLTTSAKTLQLNTLGNLVDLEKPLLDLIQENITVKKYVYDDDVNVEAAPQPATPVIRNTRSKSRKSKS